MIMMNQTTLKAGLVIRYNGGLYRVDHCNQSRARILPLTRRQIEAESFDGEERGGVNISASACVDIVEDVSRASDELELRKTEFAIKKLRIEAEKATALAALVAAKPAKGVKPAVPAATATKPTNGATKPTMPTKTGTPRAEKGQGWVRSAKPVTPFRAGSLAETVLAYISANPGLTTAAIVTGVGIEGAIAACVSRFNQAGLIAKA
jgi:hypothetical protein